MNVLTRDAIDSATTEIVDRITTRLDQESRRLPPIALAAGQYLDHPAFDQRGLYGTAAAILVLSYQNVSDPTVVTQLGRLSYYVVNRLAVERMSVSPANFAAYIQRRVMLQSGDTFRLADVGFALSRMTPAASNRAQAVDETIGALQTTRLVPAGFAIGTELNDADPLATAHAVRCLAANNMPIRSSDWRLLVEYARTGDNHYVRAFVLYVLAIYRPELAAVLRKHWCDLFGLLRGEFQSTNNEANYEYTRFGQQDYVRVPWQLYLVQAGARLFPLTRFCQYVIQRKIMAITADICSADGFRYSASGPYLSTRTYSCVRQMYREITEFNLTRPLPKLVLQSYTSTTKLLASRWSNALGLALMLVIAVVSVGLWVGSPQFSVNDLAPNIIVEVLLGVAVFASYRIHRR